MPLGTPPIQRCARVSVCAIFSLPGNGANGATPPVCPGSLSKSGSVTGELDAADGPVAAESGYGAGVPKTFFLNQWLPLASSTPWRRQRGLRCMASRDEPSGTLRTSRGHKPRRRSPQRWVVQLIANSLPPERKIGKTVSARIRINSSLFFLADGALGSSKRACMR